MRGLFAVMSIALAGCGSTNRVIVQVIPVVPRDPPLPRPSPSPASETAQAVRTIAPGVLHGLKLAGELTVTPDAETVAAATAAGRTAIAAVVSVCLDDDGNAVAELRQPSGQPAFDGAVVATVAAWRFRPHLDQGRATPVCSTATFQLALGGTATATAPALPARERELPPSIENPGVLPPQSRRVRPHRAVALASFCRVPGAKAAPEITWLQSSGDLATDRALSERRETAPIGEARADLPTCRLRAAVARPSRTDPAPPLEISPQALEEVRISGDRASIPSEKILQSMERRDVPELSVLARACIDRTGVVDAVEILRPSGFLPYDADLINTIAAWRYRPVEVDGAPVPVCSTIEFVYRPDPAACERTLDNPRPRCGQPPPPPPPPPP